MKQSSARKENETTQCSSSKQQIDNASIELSEKINYLMANKRLLERKLVDSKYIFDDLSNETIYNLHMDMFLTCANNMLASQGRTFIVDEKNADIIKFLLYYFNNCQLALSVFPNRKYDLNKNILLIGDIGVGKTLIMDAFSLYLKETGNPRYFQCTSQTQLLNSYKLQNNIDKFIYNENETRSFSGNPYNLCLNDIGLQTQKFYGQDVKQVIDEFLYARYEIWATKGKFIHLTTNLDKQDIESLFNDEYGRLKDRFKMYNVVPIIGTSKR